MSLVWRILTTESGFKLHFRTFPSSSLGIAYLLQLLTHEVSSVTWSIETSEYLLTPVCPQPPRILHSAGGVVVAKVDEYIEAKRTRKKEEGGLGGP